jgi:hypothetical protein
MQIHGATDFAAPPWDWQCPAGTVGSRNPGYVTPALARPTVERRRRCDRTTPGSAPISARRQPAAPRDPLLFGPRDYQGAARALVDRLPGSL